MFDFQGNKSEEDKKSHVSVREMEKGMNFSDNNMINSPIIIAGMSHEMRTHMNAIVAFSYLMKEDCCKKPEREEFSNQILNSCEQLIRLFESFLDSAIIDTGTTESDKKNYNMNNVLDNLISEFRELLRTEGRTDLELVSEIQFANSSDVYIDGKRIIRVIRSLFRNSINNTKSGYIKIGYNFRDDKLTFYVLDSGHGYFKCKEFLNTEDINESLALYNDTYTAINITLIKKLIQILGGTIWIDCNGLTGSGVYFSVPARMASETRADLNKYIKTMIAI
jgi:signal transduction histidine kinase